MKSTRSLLVVLVISSLSIPLLSASPAGAGTAGLLCMGAPAQSGWTGSPNLQATPEAALEGGSGDDVLEGTEGNDVIIGGGGNDTIHGNGGNDQICGDDDSNPVTGNDTIHGGMDADLIYPGAGTDDVHGGAQGEEDDSISDQMTYLFASGAPTLAGVEIDVETGTAGDKGSGTFVGTDTFEGVEILGGTFQNDNLIGSETTDDYFAGYLGDDDIQGKGGTDTISFQLAQQGVNAFLEGGTANGDGDDTITSFEYLIGTNFADFLVGTDDTNVIFGGNGNDYIWGRGGIDPIVAEGGSDHIFGGSGTLDWIVHEDRPLAPVEVNFTTGRAVLGGTEEECTGLSPPLTCEVDEIFGIEVASGSSTDDKFTGSNGDNFFIAEAGDDEVNGKDGDDIIAYFRATTRIEADLDAGGENITGASTGNDKVRNVEGLTGTFYNDVLRGSAEDNFLNALDGNDKIFSEGGNDYIVPGPGKDKIDGGNGSEDLVDFINATTKVVADLANGTAQGEGNDTIEEIEELSGSAQGDVFRGDGKANKLLGAAGADKLFGRDGNDEIDGQDGSDDIHGDSGKDSCLTKNENASKDCEVYKAPQEHPLSEVSRRYKRLEDLDRRYKRRYK